MPAALFCGVMRGGGRVFYVCAYARVGMRTGPGPLPTAPHERSPPQEFFTIVSSKVMKNVTLVDFGSCFQGRYVNSLGAQNATTTGAFLP